MQVDEIRTVLVAGAGTMGRQIALNCAMHGYQVELYDAFPEAIEGALARAAGEAAELVAEGRLSQAEAEAALGQIHPVSDLAASAAEADLVSESVPEDPGVKGALFGRLHELCPPRTIFTTNTSTLLPSQFADETGRPRQFCAFHFHNPVWAANVVDIMPHPETDPAVVALLEAFAPRIGQIPILVQKEHGGYVFNTMLGAVLREAVGLVAEGVATYQDVDRAWMGTTKMGVGPFGIIDLIGLDLVYEITERATKWTGFLPRVKRYKRVLGERVAQGKLGVKSGEGFYKYPNPRYAKKDFV